MAAGGCSVPDGHTVYTRRAAQALPLQSPYFGTPPPHKTQLSPVGQVVWLKSHAVNDPLGGVVGRWHWPASSGCCAQFSESLLARDPPGQLAAFPTAARPPKQ